MSQMNAFFDRIESRCVVMALLGPFPADVFAVAEEDWHPRQFVTHRAPDEYHSAGVLLPPGDGTQQENSTHIRIGSIRRPAASLSN
jgi:hypothetical protein